MSREYRQLLIKAAPADDLEEKRGLNFMPGSRFEWEGSSQAARRGGGLLPKGKGNKRALAKRALAISKVSQGHASYARNVRAGVSASRPQRGNFRSGQDQIANLTGAIKRNDNRAFRTGAAAGRLMRGSGGRTRARF